MKLTKWEVGQELIAISDYFAEKHDEIKDSLTENDQDNYKLDKARALIGDVFNNGNNDHKFGIYDSKDFLCKANSINCINESKGDK